MLCSTRPAASKDLEFQKLAQAFGLGARDGNFARALVVHFEHVAGLEPGDDFLDVVDIDEVRAVRAPETIGVEGGGKLLDGAVVGDAFEVARENGDGAVLDGRVNHVVGIHQEHAFLGFYEELNWLGGFGGSGSRRGELAHQGFGGFYWGGGGGGDFFVACAGFGVGG